MKREGSFNKYKDLEVIMYHVLSIPQLHLTMPTRSSQT